MQTKISNKPGSTTPGFAVEGEGETLSLTGALDINNLAAARRALVRSNGRGKPRILELSKLDTLDSPGALLLCSLRDHGMELAGVRDEHKSLLELVCGLKFTPLPKPKVQPRWRELIVQLGKSADDGVRDTYDVLVFSARALNASLTMLLRPARLPLASISRQIAETGIYALPIVALMAVMISIVIGYQGVAQLRPYGGEEFTINLVAVSVLREMGVLITSIMVAGRTGSAFAAEIGVMKSREEIDALKVMGLDPMVLLVVPRLLALVIALPLLTVFADIMGLVGGAAISAVSLEISPLQYLDRVHGAVTNNDFFVGLVKAPVFAVCIAIIGCMHGMRVESSAESVGRETTRAVVKTIFLVIVLDALFSILFERLGI